jgi:malate synthase
MTTRLPRAGLQIDQSLVRFVEHEALDGLDVEPGAFWQGLADLAGRFGPRNGALLDERTRLQAELDAWFAVNDPDPAAQVTLLTELGYLRETPTDVRVTTVTLDTELTAAAAPQLVVPLDNARYVLNAANARFGSLYDAVYGTDVLGDPPPSGPYDPQRGRRVVAHVRALLDEFLPLNDGSHTRATGYLVVDGRVEVDLEDGHRVTLTDPDAFVGYVGAEESPSALWFRHHGLHVAIHIDRDDPIGTDDPAGIRDVELEAATTVIMDAEDSVAAVDGEDKTHIYRNWLGLMRGDLTATFERDGRTVTRRLAGARALTTPDGTTAALRGTALMLIRNVGLLMTTPAVLDAAGEELPEGILDALMTTLIAQHDRRRPVGARNSRDGSVHIVKPKLHGPDEVRFTVELFAAVEQLLGLDAGTIKLGLMDEERRTTLNLTACVAEAADRLVFINTGFLDRTGDEIHTCMGAGPMRRKGEMKTASWLLAYEDANVDVGLAVGLPGHGQIGKGMWAMPDRMAAMLEQKGSHPAAGASCAWVPSPTAATLHAIHYHRVDVAAVQAELDGVARTSLEQLLTVPTEPDPAWSAAERTEELENNLQGILGYVSRWVGLGIGCSTVPDIRGVGLMEDRATCRISAQHVANWLAHGVVTEDEVVAALHRMAAVVDHQNADTPHYEPMLPAADGPAFRAARSLVLQGRDQPSGYTEPILHALRREQKARQSS